MSAAESTPPPPSQPYLVGAAVSMRDLLASCAAAHTISTPPRLPDPGTVGAPAERRDAA